MEGDGVAVRRAFPTHNLDHLDPFLLLDEMGPTEYGPGEAKGTPEHPHRGFETVTYLLAGTLHHRDSGGHTGTLGPGDVQWMTAGAGVVHSELPGPDLLRDGGRMHGFQVWVNLPRADKMIPPRYQDVPAARLPLVRGDDGRVAVRVIAGEALGARAPVETRTPILFLHCTAGPGGELAVPAPAAFNVFAYVIDGAGRFGRERVRAGSGQVVVFSRAGGTITLACAPDASDPVSVLVIGGQPLGEPIARYGPFVMSSEAEIAQAIADYRAGRMGRLT
ncbi:MAG TPA: pirin family protein [Polyangia bacterium]